MSGSDHLTRDDVHVAHQGFSWSTPTTNPPTGGLGGVGRQVGMGELSLPELEKPQMATLLLGMRNLENRAFGNGTIRALIKYGIGAIPHEELWVDWSWGTSIEIPAGQCSVTAAEFGIVSGSSKNIQVRILLTAMLVAGPRSSLGWPTFTEQFHLTIASPELMQPPARAKRLLVGDKGVANSKVIVTVRALGIDTTYDLGNAADSAIRTDGIVLPGATTLITFATTALLGSDIFACFLLDG